MWPLTCARSLPHLSRPTPTSARVQRGQRCVCSGGRTKEGRAPGEGRVSPLWAGVPWGSAGEAVSPGRPAGRAGLRSRDLQEPDLLTPRFGARGPSRGSLSTSVQNSPPPSGQGLWSPAPQPRTPGWLPEGPRALPLCGWGARRTFSCSCDKQTQDNAPPLLPTGGAGHSHLGGKPDCPQPRDGDPCLPETASPSLPCGPRPQKVPFPPAVPTPRLCCSETQRQPEC